MQFKELEEVVFDLMTLVEELAAIPLSLAGNYDTLRGEIRWRMEVGVSARKLWGRALSQAAADFGASVIEDVIQDIPKIPQDFILSEDTARATIACQKWLAEIRQTIPEKGSREQSAHSNTAHLDM